ncbi:KEOPS complex subunit Pcc1 [Haloplanus halobius]|uniref:KEOPS complex subunit Pcc1 n=1 Tax=Haloplanus halobius TaxID=2934938 RepID=UPI00200DEEAC|nr:KEOPS complex subunit Pcc1 [Haloplanus sp. XH21]
MSEKRACIETTHEDAPTIAAALRPDNTPSMTTRVDDGAIRTTVERETAGGLQSTVDDYVVNLTVAETVARTAREHSTQP